MSYKYSTYKKSRSNKLSKIDLTFYATIIKRLTRSVLAFKNFLIGALKQSKLTDERLELSESLMCNFYFFLYLSVIQEQ